MRKICTNTISKAQQAFLKQLTDITITATLDSPGCYQEWQEIRYQHFASFTLTLEDAQNYLYSFSSKKRVLAWKDIKVNLYI